MISEQDKAKWPEIPSFDDIDQEISKLIQQFHKEERRQKHSGKPSISPCALFSSEVSDKELALASRDIKLGCPDIEKSINKEDLNNEELDRHNLDNDRDNLDKNRDKLETVTSNQYCGQVSTSDQTSQLQGPSHNMTQGKTEGALLPLLKLHVSPTPKIVNQLSQLKKRKIKGPSKRLKCKTLKT